MPATTDETLRWPRAAILGAGSFGTAMATLLGVRLDEVLLAGRDPEIAATINREHRNPRYLGDTHLPATVRATTSAAEACGFPIIFFGVPTAATRALAQSLAASGLPAATVLVSCAKGIEFESGRRMSEVIGEVLPGCPVAVLSGPNHAEEIAAGLATCAVIGAADPALALALQQLLTLPHFRSYTSDDVAGIELGGAIKNVYAIAAGIVHGLGLGDNATAALVTRALAELTRLGTRLGGRPETFAGLSGVGDLIVTCYSRHSRNHRVGIALGQGATLAEAQAQLGMVAEGVPNTRSIHRVASRCDVRTPILDAVHAVLYEGKPAARALDELLTRDPRPETETETPP